jgi:hypothetical protein
MGRQLHGDTLRRWAGPLERLDVLPIAVVELNRNGRAELIPSLRALQHLYGDAEARCALLSLVGQDINQQSRVRLGCDLDYDKLQDLAENHRRLQQLMGIGDWQAEDVDFDGRRLEDHLTKLRPETLKKLNDLIVRAGHRLAGQSHH